MTLDLSRFGFGITGKVPHDVVQQLAPLVEAAGFRTMWFNHIPKGDALASIAVAASVTTRMRLATGVTSIDSMMTPVELVQRVREMDLPLDRLVLGVGANKPPSPLRSIEGAASLIHDELPGVPVMVGALGPKMRTLGVTAADGVLLNWLTPEAALGAAEDARRDDTEGSSEVALYIRTAMGAEHREAMTGEIDRYSAIPSYAANFKRLAFEARDAAIVVDTPQELRERLAAYQGIVNEPVLRAIVGEDTIEAYVSLVEAATN